jgi:hypothetical protein
MLSTETSLLYGAAMILKREFVTSYFHNRVLTPPQLLCSDEFMALISKTDEPSNDGVFSPGAAT